MAQAQSRPGVAPGGAPGGPGNRTPGRGRIVILNTFPLNALPRRHMRLDVMPVSLQDLANWIQRRLQEGYEIVHYIRHAAAIQALRSVGIPLSEQPNARFYVYQPGDIVIMASMRAVIVTTSRGEEVFPQDLETWIVTVV